MSPSRRPFLVARAVLFAVSAEQLTGLTIMLIRGPERADGLAFLLVGVGLPVNLLLSAVTTSLGRNWHPTVAPTGTRLAPQLATATWPRAFPLGRVFALRSGRWTGRFRRTSRLVLQPGRLWIDQPGAPLPPPGPGPFQIERPASWVSLHPGEVRVVQPLVSRKGRPGLVVQRHDGVPLFLYGDEPREAMLTEIAAAGFAVDGEEQVVTRRWARFRTVRPAPVPAWPA